MSTMKNKRIKARRQAKRKAVEMKSTRDIKKKATMIHKVNMAHATIDPAKIKKKKRNNQGLVDKFKRLLKK